LNFIFKKWLMIRKRSRKVVLAKVLPIYNKLLLSKKMVMSC